MCGIEPHGPKAGPLCPLAITEPLRPATIVQSRPARARTRTSEVGARRAPAYTTGLRERTTRLERASPGWKPGALPSELRPRGGTPGWTRTSGLCRRRAALSPLSYGRRKEPPAGVEPAPRPYKGRVLAVNTTEAKGGDGRSRTDIFLVASEALAQLSYIPLPIKGHGADGWSRTTTARGGRVTAC